MTPERKILVVDADAESRRTLGSILAEAGFEAVLAESTEEAEELIAEAPPSVVLLDPNFPRGDGLALLEELRASRPELPLLVLTTVDHESDVTHAFEAGADDYLRKPIRTAELLARIRSQLRIREYVEELARKKHDAQVMLELTQALASSLDFREILFTVVRRIADVVNVDRVSIVLAPEPEQENVGYVVVASDDEQLSNLKIDLAKYPEIQQVLRTREPLTITDVSTHPVLDGVREDVQNMKVGSMTLLPILWQEQALGVVFLRAAASRGSLSDRDVGFCRIVANATAVALRNARVMQSLRDHTQQVTFARFEAERRLRSLKRYADLFASSADGIALVDADGRLLFANPRAYEMLGHPPDSYRGQKIKDLLQPEDRERAREIWEGFRDGVFPHDVDLRMRRADGETVIASVSFSSLLHGEGAVLFSFRDVTQHRRMESELVKTKEFLESMIEASVDGIVAADMKGCIILFNKGAERIYGFSAEDVVNQMNVRALYPEEGARAIMSMIKSPQHGGPGRLESTRIEALDKLGNKIPISLSAAMIYEEGTPVATFGIFTDLREKLRVEERLAQAQQKLAMTEKQALIAELAGTAAHELNQPLTSVMGYAELLKRKLSRDTAEHQAADIIVREAERMADIVRKIGKITKYETKSYVGQQKILDLDKAAGNEDVTGKQG